MHSTGTSVFRQQFRAPHSERGKTHWSGLATLGGHLSSCFPLRTSLHISQGWVTTAKFMPHGPVTLAILNLYAAEQMLSPGVCQSSRFSWSVAG